VSAVATRPLRRGSYRVVPGEFYGTPKEVWGFRTPAREGSARAIARRFLRANAKLLGLDPELRGLAPARALGGRGAIESLGARHVIFQQRHLDLRIHRAYVTVHLDARCRVYLAKNRAVPARMLPRAAEFEISEAEATRRARRALPDRARRASVQDRERLWFPRGAKLVPAWRVRLERNRPREEWIVFVNATTGGILSRWDNAAAARGRARVFDPSPVTALEGHERLLGAGCRPRRPPPEAYREVTLHGLADGGHLEGRRVSTAPTARRVRRADRRWLLDSGARGFEEAMVYHHVDAAIRRLERLGFRGRRAIFREAVRANVNGTRQDNSWYSPWDRLLTFGTGAIDDAEDGETILHELGHAIQDAICRDFGQSFEAAAMGEGFGDYFAASFFADRKPARYRAAVMTWDGLLAGLEQELDPPCLRRVDNAWTHADFEEGPDLEHSNGEIWSAVLWEIREALGRDAADRAILESHFQLDAFTTFARGARAILDADAHLHGGRHRAALRRIFRRRRIGPIG
jgi:hypothetical protein